MGLKFDCGVLSAGLFIDSCARRSTVSISLGSTARRKSSVVLCGISEPANAMRFASSSLVGASASEKPCARRHVRPDTSILS
jgi:hypothetical protein